MKEDRHSADKMKKKKKDYAGISAMGPCCDMCSALLGAVGAPLF